MKACALILTVLCASSQGQSADQNLASELRAHDEQLLIAVHRGNKSVWDHLTTPDFLYVEDGEVTPKAALLADLEEDGSAPLTIETYAVQRIGETAIVKHLDGVPNRDNFVDNSKSKLLFLETWQRIDGTWKLRLLNIDRLRVNPTPVLLNGDQIGALIGTYVNGPHSYTIRSDGNRLFGAPAGSAEKPLLAETPSMLFLADDLFMRKVFQFNAAGQITGFIDRNIATERVWMKQTATSVSAQPR